MMTQGAETIREIRPPITIYGPMVSFAGPHADPRMSQWAGNERYGLISTELSSHLMHSRLSRLFRSSPHVFMALAVGVPRAR